MNATATETVVEIPVDLLDAHPANDPKRSTLEQCQDLLELVEEFGQREPGKVRRLPSGRYQILHGHRRATCCQFLGRPFRALVTDQDDHEATRELILGNIRRDLDPIARAELIATTLESGIATDKAARMFGMSESNLNATMRLRSLPPSLQKLLSDGTLPIREARYFVPYAEASVAADRLAVEIRKNEHMAKGWKPHTVAAAFKRLTRPCDRKTRFELSVASGAQPRRFELDEATDAKLQIVTLPVGVARRSIPVAQNTVLWDRLQKQALAKLAEEETDGQSEAKPPEPTDAPANPASKATDPENNAAEDRALAERLDRWTVTLKRAAIALQCATSQTRIAAELAPILLAQIGRDASGWLELAFRSLDDYAELSKLQPEGGTDLVALAHLQFATQFGADYLERLFVLVAYPSADIPLDHYADVLSPGVPRRLPLSEPLFDPVWDRVAFRLGIEVPELWEATADPDYPLRPLVEQFLRMHNRRQLLTLARDGFGLDWEAASVKTLLDQHRPESPLALPNYST